MKQALASIAALRSKRWVWPALGLMAVLSLCLPGLAWLLPGANPGWSLAAWFCSLGFMLLTAHELRRARRRVVEIRQMLNEALDALPASVEIFDAQDRLMAYNQQLLEIYPHMRGAFKRGATFESLVRTSLAQGRVPEASGREEAWLRERLQARRIPREPLLQQVHDGRWLRIHERHMPSGGIVGVRTEVTDMILEHQRLASTDGLTGVGNRRLFDERLQQAWQRSARLGLPLACVMVDVDHFKQYNDHYGHVAGDDCLRRVADLLSNCIKRPTDTVCRYGGEEFVLLLPDCDLAHARAVAQRCLDELRLAAIDHAASPLHHTLSFSVGVAACVAKPDLAAQSLVEQADAALYSAKQTGRARIAMQV